MGLTFEILEIKKKLLKVNCRKMFLLEKTFVFIEIRVTKSNKNCQLKKKKLFNLDYGNFLRALNEGSGIKRT